MAPPVQMSKASEQQTWDERGSQADTDIVVSIMGRGVLLAHKRHSGPPPILTE